MDDYRKNFKRRTEKLKCNFDRDFLRAIRKKF